MVLQDPDIKYMSGFLGISSNQAFGMPKSDVFEFKQGDIINFYLNLTKGEMVVRRGPSGKELARTMGLEGRMVRPVVALRNPLTNFLASRRRLTINCPGEHDLEEFLTEDGSHECNVCTKKVKVKKNTMMFGCNICNFNVCEKH